VAGRTEAEAVQNFLDPLQRALSCVTTEVVDVKGGYYASPAPHVLTLSNQPARLGRDRRFAVKVVQQYRVVEDATSRGPWTVATVAYYYTIEEANGPELLGFHFHPHERSPVTTPHLHVYAATGVSRHNLEKTHIPTSRVSLVSVLRYAIEELGVRPLRSDWTDVLAASEAASDA